ncbi:MAG TPA: response regulator [Candidatus Omnitrophota bacterium]|nr:response regulator [Candidatus Omnitrophota bacterium]HPT06903.1 response regulator [Candidatus Omnitrophota bacterium]
MAHKILVVDDEPDFLDVIKIRLESCKYEVLTAHDGKQALEVFKTAKPDAILLDIMMPDMDGLQVLKKIREVNKDVPVFMVTAFSNDERFGLAQKLNASGFIVKTGDLKKEVENITSVLTIANRYKSGK